MGAWKVVYRGLASRRRVEVQCDMTEARTLGMSEQSPLPGQFRAWIGGAPASMEEIKELVASGEPGADKLRQALERYGWSAGSN